MFNREMKPKRLAIVLAGALVLGSTEMVFGAQFNLSGLDGTNGVLLEGGSGGDRLGGAVSSAGDINADGRQDFILGSAKADPNGISSGTTYVVFGSDNALVSPFNLTSLDGSNGFLIHGAAAFDFSGFSLGAAGDMNGDGFDDVILGAPSSSLGASYAGAVYIIFGSDQAFSTPLDLSQEGEFSVISGNEADADAGSSVSSAGDFNGDGIDDLVIGAPLVGAEDSGAAYIVFGSDQAFPSSLADLNGVNGFSMPGLGLADLLGNSVTGGFDLNGDGFDDVLIGAPLAGTDGAFNGTAYVVFGTDQAFDASFDLAGLNGSNGFAINGLQNGDQFGNSTGIAGDINGDGLDDLIIGAPKSDNSTGTSYVIFGSLTEFSANFDLANLDGLGLVLTGVKPGDEAGAAVGGRIDLNRDGVEDLVIGAPLADSSVENAGSSYVVFGNESDLPTQISLSGLNGVNGFRIHGIGANSRSGSSVDVAGDVNGDGWNDLMIGAPLSDSPGIDSGEGYVVYSIITSVLEVIFSNGFE